MRIAAISDLHGYPIPRLPECDLLIIAGDYEDGSTYAVGSPWYGGFLDQLSKIKPGVIAVPGNHDGMTEKNEDIMRSRPAWNLLIDESIIFQGAHIYGAPWTPTFFNWHYMSEEHELKKKWARIPEGTEILITHGPPYGILDSNSHGTRVGSYSLRDRIGQLSNLKLHIFGHIHEQGGEHEEVDGVLFVNASFVDVVLEPVNPLTLIDFEDGSASVVDW